MRRFVWVVLFVISACGVRAADLAEWGGAAGWDHWEIDPQLPGPIAMERANDPYPESPYLQTGEATTGSLRSPVFTVTGDMLEFWCNGWDGREGKAGRNVLRLVDEMDGTVLRSWTPPLSDAFAPGGWYVGDLKDRDVRFEVQDNLSASGFAWIGLAACRETRLDPGSDPSAFLPLELPSALGIFALETSTFITGPTPPFLSSKADGEDRQGRVLSPVFKVSDNSISISLRGWSGPSNAPRHLNRATLVDARTNEVLRTAEPPQNDLPKTTVWNVAALRGREVRIVIEDGDDNPAFAWVGVNAIDAGVAYSVDFSDGRSAREGWSTPGIQNGFISVGGVPFRYSPQSLMTVSSTVTFEVGHTTERIFFYGMYNKPDKGCPVWGQPYNYGWRWIIGDRLGEIRVVYASGVQETYPLVLGDNLWWGTRFAQFPEPFASNEQKAVELARNLRVYPPNLTAGGRYLACIRPRGGVVERIELVDNGWKDGVPVILGMTCELPDTEDPATLRTSINDDLAAWLATNAMVPEGDGYGRALRRVDNVRNLIYGSHARFPQSVETSAPEAYTGPTARFAGTPAAAVLTNIWHHNAHDMAGKFDEQGFYHTSSEGAPSWGGYEGGGTWARGWSSYHGQIWARDLGRALQEIVWLGYLGKGRDCADYSFLLARVWETGPTPEMDLKPENIGPLTLNGHPIPAHWSRRLNYPSTKPHEGCFDNDSHGLTMLGVYRLWRSLPEREEWLRSNWEDVVKAAHWVEWQLDNPEISGSRDGVLWTDSESAGGQGHTIYADYSCMEGLLGFAEMADSIGNTEQATSWHKTAARMREAMLEQYVVEDASYGRTWTLKNAGWPNQSTVLAPVLYVPDRQGLAPEDIDPEMRMITEASYERLIDQAAEYTPFGYYGVAMGYGQAFVTQTALLLDRMDQAANLLDWTARLVYCDVEEASFRYIVPEGVEIHPEGHYWWRIGDLGNGVQQAETVKTLRLVLGIDDTDPATPRLFPRMPADWKHIEVRDWLMLVESEGEWQNRRVTFELDRDGDDLRLMFAADQPVPEMEVRLGPWHPTIAAFQVWLNGKPVTSQSEMSGDSRWLRLRVPEGQQFELQARPDNL